MNANWWLRHNTKLQHTVVRKLIRVGEKVYQNFRWGKYQKVIYKMAAMTECEIL